MMKLYQEVKNGIFPFISQTALPSSITCVFAFVGEDFLNFSSTEGATKYIYNISKNILNAEFCLQTIDSIITYLTEDLLSL